MKGRRVLLEEKLINTKVKIVTLMVKKEYEFFFLIIRGHKGPRRKETRWKGESSICDHISKSRPQDRPGKGKSRRDWERSSIPRAAGWLGRGTAVFATTDQKPGRGAPEAKTRKVIFHRD